MYYVRRLQSDEFVRQRAPGRSMILMAHYLFKEVTVNQDGSRAVLSVKNLRKQFVRGFFRKKTVAVDQISFSVEQGEIFGFLGPNGAGKTTTIKMLMGLLFPSSGSAKVLGQNAGNIVAKRAVGYLPENPYFYDYLSASEYLHMVGRIYGLARSTRIKRVGELLDRLGVGMAQHRPMRSYSKGMLQRVGLAQALVGDPRLLVFDEPMSGLDPLGRHEVRELITDLRQQGKTVFFSTHILSDANLLCDRVAIIVKGKIKDVGPLGELLNPKIHRYDVLWSAPTESSSRLREAHVGEFQTTSEGEIFQCQGQETLNQFIHDLTGIGGNVLQVNARRETLEELFLRDAAGPAEALRS